MPMKKGSSARGSSTECEEEKRGERECIVIVGSRGS